MIDLTDRELFTPLVSEESGVTMYVLTHRVAPLQKGFYFVNDCMSADARYLWFCCGYPPSPLKSLAVIDFATHEVRHFPETQFTGESPFVDSLSGEIYWAAGSSIWRRSPDPSGLPDLVNSLPADLVGGRHVSRVATHLTRSADGRAFFADAQFGLQFVFGTLPVDGGPFESWYRFDRNYNHAQMSPTDPDVVLFAQENHPDPLTGLTFQITNRLWVMRRGESPRPVLKEPRWVTHEWWDADGAHVWCVWGNETWRVDVATGDVEVVPFPHHCWHSHSSLDGSLIVGDSNTRFYRGCPSGVHFLNRRAGRMLTLAHNPERPDYAGRNYHIDPHPRFCSGDRYVVFTLTLRGEIDLVVLPTAALVAATGG